MAKKDESTAIVPVNEYALMSIDAPINEVIEENLGDEELNPVSDLEKIQVPSGGATVWTIPTIDGEEDVKELTGIIVHTQRVRLYWAESFENSGSTPPDCYSDDGKHGIGTPGGLCSECPMNQWGSADKGNGKACQERRLLYMLRPDSILPVVINVPPTSLKPIRQYLVRLAGKGLSSYSVYTKLLLEKDKSEGGINYAKIKPAPAGQIEKEKVQEVKAYVSGIKPYLQSAANLATEVGAEEKPAPDNPQEEDGPF